MPRALSFDLRVRVLAAVAQGLSHRQAGERFGVSAASVSRWRALEREQGEACARFTGRRSPIRTGRGAQRHDPRAYRRNARHRDRRAAPSARRQRRNGWLRDDPPLLRPPRHHAKKKTRHAAEQDRPDVLKQRQAWFEGQLDLDPERLVFIDETWASTNMARTHGRCRRGQRLRVGVPHGHWKTTTFVAGLTTRGMIAPFVLDGPINRNAFETYVERVLVPELRKGDIVVIDNLSSHKGSRTREMIEAAGARLLYLPPYSPDFNPIENAFAKLKALLRKAAERTVDRLWEAIGRMVDLFTPAECRNYFEAAGYDAT